MKKLSMICMAALLLLAASCKKNEKTEQYYGEGFRATAEAQLGNSKTHLDAELNVDWNEGDAILALSDGCPEGHEFVAIQGGEIETEFIAKGGNPEGLFAEGYTYTAFYPYANVSVASLRNDAYTLALLAEQDAVYEDDAFKCSFANESNPMAATSTDKNLEFKNLCGMLELSLYSETACYVNNITLTTKGDESLYGAGEVTFNEGVPQLGALADGGKTLTLNCDDGLMSQDESNPSHFCFVLPVGALANGFEVTLTDKDGKTWTKSTEKNNTIVRSKICQMDALKVTFASDAPEGFVDFGTHVGGIGGEEPLYWAKCNVGAENCWEPGNYFLWGYTAKDNHCGYFDGTSYLFGTERGGGEIWLHRYCVNSNQWEYKAGVSFDTEMDGLSELLDEDDAAYQDNNKNRMPTYDEMYELYTVAYFEWTSDYSGKNVAGSIIWKAKDVNDMGKRNVYETSHNANYSLDDPHIFIPVSGRHVFTGEIDQQNRVYFWTRTLWIGESTPGDSGCEYAAAFRETSDTHNSEGGAGRCVGLPVRPVREASKN